jgi:hypothetical protein
MQTEDFAMPQALEIAILKTLAYADVFDFPMKAAEIHHFLLGAQANLEAVQATLADSHWLGGHIEQIDGYHTLCGRQHLVEIRKKRQAASADLWQQATRYGAFLGALPYMRMVALTGSLAMQNPQHNQDDIDFLLITREGRVWLGRLFAVAVVRLAKLRGIGLCPNYVLTENALQQDRQNIYVAHELAQMIPITGPMLYAKMRAENVWAEAILPNAAGPFWPIPSQDRNGVLRWVKHAVETLLNTPLGDALERWERQRKIRKFASENQQRGAAQLDAQQVKGHFQDHGARVLADYEARLLSLGLTETEQPGQPQKA